VTPKILVSICTRGDSQNLVKLISNLTSQIVSTNIPARIAITSNSSHYFNFEHDIVQIIDAPLGYAQTRQASLAHLQTEEYLIFLDDDNLICDDWLKSLSEAIKQNEGIAVKGRIEYVNLDGTEATFWSDRLEKNMQLRYAGMSNLALPPNYTSCEEFYFDDIFEKGGEDTDLTFRLVRKKGMKIIVDDTFPVKEIVTKAKNEKEYLQLRKMSGILIYTRVIVLNGNSFEKAFRFFSGLIHLMRVRNFSFSELFRIHIYEFRSCRRSFPSANQQAKK
jgi:glycosyltransferase involved in cell wall biosynthesis